MSQTLQDGIEAIRRQAVATQGMVAFADQLEQALSSINAADGAKKLATQAIAERDAALVELAQAKQDIEHAKAKGAGVLAAAEESAAAVAAQAEQDAQAVADKAAQEAAGAVSAALSAAQAALAQVKSQRDGVSKDIVDLNGKKAEAQAALDAVSAELDDKQSALDSVKAAIAALRG